MMKSIGQVILLVFVTALQPGYSDTPQPTEHIENAADDTPAQHAIKHQDPKYVCPMHPQIVKDEAGNFPICGMNLVAKAVTSLPQIEQTPPQVPTESMEMAMGDTATQHGIKHQDPKYICPMHPQIVRDEEGSCPICGMNLVKKQIAPSSLTREKNILYWVAPMDPNYRRDEPGKSPMGMDLVPVYDETDGTPAKDGYPAISITAEIIQNLGIRTEKISRETLRQQIRTVGRIDYDETRLSHVHLRADGWFEKLYIKAEGDPVTKNQIIGDYYAPAILSAQVDFLVALSSSQKSKLNQARNGLRLLGVTEETIAGIEQDGFTRNTIQIKSPASGIVSQLGVREGMYATPATEAVAIASLDDVWVNIDLFEHQISTVEIGTEANIKVPAWPDQTWAGKVAYIYPELDPKSRTLRARVTLKNPGGALKPNMYAEITLLGKPKSETLTIPREALISTGERDVVIRRLDKGRFQPVNVKTGMRANNRIEILEGLTDNDEVVVSGQFLIDSESSLQASFLRLTGE